MDWKEFTIKYGQLSQEFNDQDINERIRLSRFMAYESIRELIRSKKHYQKVIDEIDNRIKQLTPELDNYLKITTTPPIVTKGS